MELTRTGGQEERGYDRVFGFIRQQLVNQELRAGEVLLSERELSARLGVSRPATREALRALAALGVIEIRHGFGSVVRKPDFGQLADFFTLMLAQQEESVDDITEARVAIERQAIRLACRRATDADIDRLREALAEISATVRDPKAGAAADFHFHELLIKAAHSATLTTLHAAIATLLQRSHLERRTRISNLSELDAYLVDHHRQILEAVIRRNEAEADDLLIKHFAIGSDLQRLAAIGAKGAATERR